MSGIPPTNRSTPNKSEGIDIDGVDIPAVTDPAQKGEEKQSSPTASGNPPDLSNGRNSSLPVIGGVAMTSTHMKEHSVHMDKILNTLNSDKHLGAVDIKIQDLQCPEWLRLALSAMDIDHSGTVNREELTHYLKAIANARKRKENNSKELDYRDMAECVQEALKVWDADGSGTVSVSELTAAAKAQKKMEQENRYLKYGVILLILMIILLAVMNFVCALAAVEAGKDMRPNESKSTSSHRNRQLRSSSSALEKEQLEKAMVWLTAKRNPVEHNRMLIERAERLGRRILHAGGDAGATKPGALTVDGDVNGNVQTANLKDETMGPAVLPLLTAITPNDFGNIQELVLPSPAGGKFACKPQGMTESVDVTGAAPGLITKTLECAEEQGESKSVSVHIPPTDDAGTALAGMPVSTPPYNPADPAHYCHLRRTRLLTRDGRITHHRKPSFERMMKVFKSEARRLRRLEMAEAEEGFEGDGNARSRQLSDEDQHLSSMAGDSFSIFTDEEWRHLQDANTHEKLTHTYITETIGDASYTVYAEDIYDNGLGMHGMQPANCQGVAAPVLGPAARQLLENKIKIIHSREQRRLEGRPYMGRALQATCPTSGVVPVSTLNTATAEDVAATLNACFDKDYDAAEDAVIKPPNTAGTEAVEAKMTLELGFEPTPKSATPASPDICAFTADPKECLFTTGAELKAACDAHPDCPFKKNGGMPIAGGPMVGAGKDPNNTAADFATIIADVEFPIGAGASPEEIMNHFNPESGSSEKFDDMKDRVATHSTDVIRETVAAAHQSAHMNRRLDEAELLNGNYRRRVRVVRSLEVDHPKKKGEKIMKHIRRLESPISHEMTHRRRMSAGRELARGDSVSDFDVSFVAREMDKKLDARNVCRKNGIETSIVVKDICDKASFLCEGREGPAGAEMIVSECDKDGFPGEISDEEYECIEKKMTRNVNEQLEKEKEPKKETNSQGCTASKKPLPEKGLKCDSFKEVKKYLRCKPKDNEGCIKKCKALDQDGDGILKEEECAAAGGNLSLWDWALRECAGDDEDKKRKCGKQGVRVRDCQKALMDSGDIQNKLAAKVICHLRDTLDGNVAKARQHGISKAEMNTEFHVIVSKLDGGSANDGSAINSRIRRLLDHSVYVSDPKTGRVRKTFDHGIHRSTDHSIEGGNKRRRALFGQSKGRMLAASSLPFGQKSSSAVVQSNAARRILAGQVIADYDEGSNPKVEETDIFHDLLFGELVHRPRMRRMEAKIIRRESALRKGMQQKLSESKYNRWLLERRLKHTEKLRRRRILLSFDRETDDPDEVHRKLQRVNRRLHEISYHSHNQGGKHLEKEGRKLVEQDDDEERALRHLLNDDSHYLSDNMDIYTALFNIKANGKDMEELMTLTHAAKRNLQAANEMRYFDLGGDIGKCLDHECLATKQLPGDPQGDPKTLSHWIITKFEKTGKKMKWKLKPQQRMILKTMLKAGAKRKNKKWVVKDASKVEKVAMDVGMYFAERMPSDKVAEERQETGAVVETPHNFEKVRNEGETLCEATSAGRRMLAKHRQLLEIVERRRMRVLSEIDSGMVSEERHHRRQLEEVDEMLRKLSGANPGFVDIVETCRTPVITPAEMLNMYPDEPEKIARMKGTSDREVDNVLTRAEQRQNRLLKSLDSVLTEHEKRELSMIEHENRALADANAEEGGLEVLPMTQCGFFAAESPAAAANLENSGFNAVAKAEGDPMWCTAEMNSYTAVQTDMPECLGAEKLDSGVSHISQYEMNTPELTPGGKVNDWATCSGFPQYAPGENTDHTEMENILNALAPAGTATIKLPDYTAAAFPMPQTEFVMPPEQPGAAPVVTGGNTVTVAPAATLAPGASTPRQLSSEELRKLSEYEKELSLKDDPVRRLQYIHSTRSGNGKLNKRLLMTKSKNPVQNLSRRERKLFQEDTPKYMRHIRNLSESTDLTMDMFQHKRRPVSYKQALKLKAQETVRRERRRLLAEGGVSYGVQHLASVNVDAHGRRLTEELDPAYCATLDKTDPSQLSQVLACQTGQTNEDPSSMAATNTCMGKDGLDRPKPDENTRPAREAEEITFFSWLQDLMNNWERLPRSCQALPAPERILPTNGGTHNVNLDSLNTFINNLKADKMGVGCIEECGCVFVGTDPVDGSEFIANTCDSRRPCLCMEHKKNCMDEIGDLWEARGGYNYGDDPAVRSSDRLEDNISRRLQVAMGIVGKSGKRGKKLGMKRRDKKLAQMKSVRKYRRESLQYNKLTKYDNHRILHELKMKKEKRRSLAKKRLTDQDYQNLEKAEHIFHKGFGKASFSIRKLTGKRGDRFRKLKTLDHAHKIRRRILTEKLRNLRQLQATGTAKDYPGAIISAGMGYLDSNGRPNPDKASTLAPGATTVNPAVDPLAYAAANPGSGYAGAGGAGSLATKAPAIPAAGYTGPVVAGTPAAGLPAHLVTAGYAGTDAPGTGNNIDGLQGNGLKDLTVTAIPFAKEPAAASVLGPNEFSEVNPIDLKELISAGLYNGNNEWLDITAMSVQPISRKIITTGLENGTYTDPKNLIGGETPTYDLCIEAYDLGAWQRGADFNTTTKIPFKSMSTCYQVRPYKVEEFGYHPLILEDFHQGQLYCPDYAAIGNVDDERAFKNALNMYEDRGTNPAMHAAFPDHSCIDGMPVLTDMVGDHIAAQDRERSYGSGVVPPGSSDRDSTFGDDMGTSSRPRPENTAREVHEACSTESLTTRDKMRMLREFASEYQCNRPGCDPLEFTCDAASMQDPENFKHDEREMQYIRERNEEFTDPNCGPGEELGALMDRQIEEFEMDGTGNVALLGNRLLRDKYEEIEARAKTAVSDDTIAHALGFATEEIVGGTDIHYMMSEGMARGEIASALPITDVQGGTLFAKMTENNRDTRNKGITIGDIANWHSKTCVEETDVIAGSREFCDELAGMLEQIGDLVIENPDDLGRGQSAWDYAVENRGSAIIYEESFKTAHDLAYEGHRMSSAGDSIARNDYVCMGLVADTQHCGDRSCMQTAYEESTRGDDVLTGARMGGVRTEQEAILTETFSEGQALTRAERKTREETMHRTQDVVHSTNAILRAESALTSTADMITSTTVRASRRRILREARRSLQMEHELELAEANRELAAAEASKDMDKTEQARRRLDIISTKPRKLSDSHFKDAEERHERHLEEHTGMTKRERVQQFAAMGQERKRRLSEALQARFSGKTGSSRFHQHHDSKMNVRKLSTGGMGTLARDDVSNTKGPKTQKMRNMLRKLQMDTITVSSKGMGGGLSCPPGETAMDVWNPVTMTNVPECQPEPPMPGMACADCMFSNTVETHVDGVATTVVGMPVDTIKSTVETVIAAYAAVDTHSSTMDAHCTGLMPDTPGAIADGQKETATFASTFMSDYMYYDLPTLMNITANIQAVEHLANNATSVAITASKGNPKQFNSTMPPLDSAPTSNVDPIVYALTMPEAEVLGGVINTYIEHSEAMIPPVEQSAEVNQADMYANCMSSHSDAAGGMLAPMINGVMEPAYADAAATYADADPWTAAAAMDPTIPIDPAAPTDPADMTDPAAICAMELAETCTNGPESPCWMADVSQNTAPEDAAVHPDFQPHLATVETPCDGMSVAPQTAGDGGSTGYGLGGSAWASRRILKKVDTHHKKFSRAHDRKYAEKAHLHRTLKRNLFGHKRRMTKNTKAILSGRREHQKRRLQKLLNGDLIAQRIGHKRQRRVLLLDTHITPQMRRERRERRQRRMEAFYKSRRELAGKDGESAAKRMLPPSGTEGDYMYLPAADLGTTCDTHQLNYADSSFLTSGCAPGTGCVAPDENFSQEVLDVCSGMYYEDTLATMEAGLAVTEQANVMKNAETQPPAIDTFVDNYYDPNFEVEDYTWLWPTVFPASRQLLEGAVDKSGRGELDRFDQVKNQLFSGASVTSGALVVAQQFNNPFKNFSKAAMKQDMVQRRMASRSLKSTVRSMKTMRGMKKMPSLGGLRNDKSQHAKDTIAKLRADMQSRAEKAVLTRRGLRSRSHFQDSNRKILNAKMNIKHAVINLKQLLRVEAQKRQLEIAKLGTEDAKKNFSQKIDLFKGITPNPFLKRVLSVVHKSVSRRLRARELKADERKLQTKEDPYGIADEVVTTMAPLDAAFYVPTTNEPPTIDEYHNDLGLGMTPTDTNMSSDFVKSYDTEDNDPAPKAGSPVPPAETPASELAAEMVKDEYIEAEHHGANNDDEMKATEALWSTTTLAPGAALPAGTVTVAATTKPSAVPKLEKPEAMVAATGTTVTPPVQDSAGTAVSASELAATNAPLAKTVPPIADSTTYGSDYVTECKWDMTVTPPLETCCEVYTGTDMALINSSAEDCYTKLGEYPDLYEDMGLFGDNESDSVKEQSEQKERKKAQELPPQDKMDELTLNCVENAMFGDGTPSGMPPKAEVDEDEDCENLPESDMMEQHCDEFCYEGMSSCNVCETHQVDYKRDCELKKQTSKKSKTLENIMIKLAKKKAKIAVGAGIKIQARRALMEGQEVPSLIRKLAQLPQDWEGLEVVKRDLLSYDRRALITSSYDDEIAYTVFENTTNATAITDPVTVANDAEFCTLNIGNEDPNDELYGTPEAVDETSTEMILAMTTGGMGLDFSPNMKKLLEEYAEAVHEQVHDVYNKLRNPDGVYLSKMLKYAANFKQIEKIVFTLREIAKIQELGWEDECRDFYSTEELACNGLQWMSRGYNSSMVYDWQSGKEWWEHEASQPFIDTPSRPHSVCLRNARSIARENSRQIRTALGEMLKRIGDWNPTNGRPRWLKRIEDNGAWKEQTDGTWGPTPYNKESAIMTAAEKESLCDDVYGDQNGMGYADFSRRYWHWDPNTYTSTYIDEPKVGVYRSIKDDILSCANFPEGCAKSAKLFKKACIKTLNAIEETLIPTNKMGTHCSQWGWCSDNYDLSDDFINKFYPNGHDQNGEVQPPYRSIWDMEEMRRALLAMFDVTHIPEWMFDYTPWNAGENYPHDSIPGTKIGRCMLKNVKENVVEKMLKEMLASVEKKQKSPQQMCKAMIEQKYTTMNFTNFTNTPQGMAFQNSTSFEKATAMAATLDDDCKRYCVEYEDWKSSSASQVTKTATFNTTTFLEKGNSLTDLMPPAKVEGCDAATACEVVADFTSAAEQSNLAGEIYSRRVRRQRRQRRALIEKRRRLEQEDRDHRRRLANNDGKDVSDRNNCVTLNGEKYCKEGTLAKATNSDDFDLSHDHERRLQAQSDFYEERGIDVIVPAARTPTKGHKKHKMRKGLLKKNRMARRFRKLGRK